MIDPVPPALRLCAAALVAGLAACAAPEPPRAPDVPRYKIGAPYRIEGVLYRPAEDPAYDETGIASWYGPRFDGQTTANGEVFDMRRLTAAHRTLPMPSVVEVTNLDNGRRIAVRVNDRGPFARGRIIDVSRRAAQLLGFEHRGTAKVRVRILADESLILKQQAMGVEAPPPPLPAAPAVAVAAADLPRVPMARAGASAEAPPRDGGGGPRPARSDGVETDRGAAEAAVVTVAVPREGRIFVQAGAFAEPGNANRLRNLLAPLGQTRIETTVIDGRTYYRVRVGPVGTVEDGDRLLATVVDAGAGSARLIVD